MEVVGTFAPDIHASVLQRRALALSSLDMLDMKAVTQGVPGSMHRTT